MIKLEDNVSIKDCMYDTSDDYAIIRLEFLSDGINSHGLPFTTELIKEYAGTILGKFIVAKYDKNLNDVLGHETDEVIVGYIPETAVIEFKETANGMFACVDGIISKIYAPEVYELYKTHNNRAVSVEVTCRFTDETESEMVGFNIHSVTLLGLHIKPSCALAHSKIVKFSEECESYYQRNCVTKKLGNGKGEMQNMNKNSWEAVLAMMAEHEGEGFAIGEVTAEKITYSLSDIQYTVDAKVEMSEVGEPINAEINWETKALLEDATEDEPIDDGKSTLAEPEDDKDETEKLEDDDTTDTTVEEPKEEELSVEELKNELAEKDNIVMECEKELAELRAYKEARETEERDNIVMETLAEVKNAFSDKEFAELEEKGKSFALSEINAWKNNVKALAFDSITTNKDFKFTQDDVHVFGGDNQPQSQAVQKTSSGLWYK